jgi:hypothetical protein
MIALTLSISYGSLINLGTFQRAKSFSKTSSKIAGVSNFQSLKTLFSCMNSLYFLITFKGLENYGISSLLFSTIHEFTKYNFSS